MRPLVVPLPGNEDLARSLALGLDAEPCALEARYFPDGESYVRLDGPVAGRQVILACTLDRPDAKYLRLAFTAAAARDLGAVEVGLVCPYLAYMRQDRRFRAGEAVTSTTFAEALSSWIDWLVTVDPHLHRRTSLAEIFAVPAKVVHAAPALADWIGDSVASPVLIGPDSESAQWVSAVAALAGAPFVVLDKVRRGDRDVEVSVPQLERWRRHTPVLVDDIISTARTMIETVGHLKAAEMPSPVCLGVHGVFANDAYDALRAAGGARIVTCNTIAHESNGIDLTEPLVEAIRQFLESGARRT